MPTPASSDIESRSAAAGAPAGALAHVQNASLLAIAWFAIAGMGHSLSPGDDAQGFFWLPAGLLLSVLLLTSRREWPGLVVGAILGDTVYGMAHDLPSRMIAFRAGVTVLQALFGAELAERLASRPFHLRTAGDLLIFLLAATGVATLAGSLLGVVLIDGIPSADAFAKGLLARWGSNAVGVLVLAPLILAWSEPVDDHSASSPGLEAVLLAIATVACLALVFGSADAMLSPLRFLLVAPVVWAALRFGLQGASTAALVVALAVAFFTGIDPGGITEMRSASPFDDGQLTIALFVLVGLSLAVGGRTAAGKR